MDSNPYKPSASAVENQAPFPPIDWKRFAILNILWGGFIGCAIIGFLYSSGIPPSKQLPQPYASYDPEFFIAKPAELVVVFLVFTMPCIFYFIFRTFTASLSRTTGNNATQAETNVT